ncbi:MAG: acyl carrier protein, partial [Gammaproteobacteria bacterium]
PMGRAVRVLADLLGSGVAQAAPVDINWSLFRSLYQARGRCRLFDLVAGEGAADTSPEPPAEAGIRERLSGAPESERREILATHIQAVLGRVLGLEAGRLPDRQQGFFDMGMDSLTAMELRTKLQASLTVGLPATLAFDYGTVDTLANYLLRDQLHPAPSEPAAGAHEAGGQGDSSRQMIERMSDDEVEILLQAKLLSL